MRVVVLLFRFYTFYSFCIVLTENIFYFSNHTKNYDVDNVFFLISWDWSNTCYNAKVTTIQLCDPSALLSHLQRLRHKRQKETFSTFTFFFFFWTLQHVFCAKMRWDSPWQQEKPIFGLLGYRFRLQMCHEAFIHEANQQGNVKTSGNCE